jgi:hypothetical protein
MQIVTNYQETQPIPTTRYQLTFQTGHKTINISLGQHSQSRYLLLEFSW